MEINELLNKLVDRYNIVNNEKQSLINYKNELNKRNLKFENNIDDEICNFIEDDNSNNNNNNNKDKLIKCNFILTSLILAVLYAKYGIDNTKLVIATPLVYFGSTIISSAIYNGITNKEYVINNSYDELINNNDKLIDEVNYKIRECDKLLNDIKNTINSLNTNVESTNIIINDYNKTRKLTK